MELPTLPTDNLYKLMALSGATLLVVCVGFIVTTVFQLNDQVIDEKANAETFIVEINALETELSNSIRAGTAQAMLAEIQMRIMAGRIKAIESKARVTKLGHRATVLQAHSIHLLIGAIFGLAISVSGFWLWYKRVQRPLDKTLAA